MEINGKTRLTGLIGNPVEHTLSPLIHNEISKKTAVNSVYVPFQVEEDGLEKTVTGAYELNLLGMNVTVPYKNQVMEFLADTDEAAGQIGAVNTLVRMEELRGFKGYNTDYIGLKRQLEEDHISLKDQTVVILGAGGVAKAVVYLCLKEGAAKIYLLNRTLSKACKIAGCFDETGRIIPMELSDYKKIVETGFLCFQATSIGLYPNVDEVVIEDEAFYKKISVGVDLIYNPANTKFMQLVTSCGGKAYNALKMLLYQGVAAYELWHTVKVPLEILEDVLVELKRAVYPKDNIVLIGFMGSGKTTVGMELAKRKNMDFLDTDAYIEEQEGMTISEIFAKKGEAYFRRVETERLCHFRDTLNNTVISTGGGMPLRKENAQLLKEIGKVYYLTAANQIIYDRVKSDSKRPLLQNKKPYEKICELMKERKPLYEAAADVLIDTNSNELDVVIADIEKYLPED